MRTNLLFSVLLLACAGGSAWAQTVSENEALGKAISFLSHGRRAPGEANVELAYTSATETETHYYVFNYGSDEGYVIIGGDMAAQEVLAYGETGHFDYEALPPQMKDWLTGYSDQIHEAIRQVKDGETVIVSEADKKQASRRASGRSNISALLTTKWDQIAPYNSQMPFNQKSGYTGSYSFATGCVATAGAQIMKYYNWPDSGVGSHTSNKGINGEWFSADFENTVYQWDKMKDTYDPEGQQYGVYHGTEEEIAVGTLMYHIGVSVDMSYGQFRSNGSSSSSYDLAKSLITYFKYSKMISYEERNYYSDQDWEDLIYAELAANRPVLYRGSEGELGHAFVCDGYQNGKFHINWGWNGSYNDYFLLTPTATEKALCPNGTGSGGGAAGSSYTTDQGAIINIMPDRDGTSEVHKAMSTYSYYLEEDQGYPGSVNILHGAIYSRSLAETEFTYGIRYVNVNNENDVVISPMYLKNTLEPNVGSTYHSFLVSRDLTVGETYYVYPLFIGDDGEWADAIISGNPVIPTLTITEPDGFVLTKDIVISNNGYVSPSSVGAFSFAVKNYGASSYLWAYISNPGWTKNFKSSLCGYVANNAENFYSLDMPSFSYLSNAPTMYIGEEYAFYIYRGGKRISTNIPFHYVEDLPIDFTMSAAGWGTICLPYEAVVPSGLKAYSVTGVDGNKLLLEPVEKMEMNTPYLLSGTPDNYSFVGPATPKVPEYTDGLLVGNVEATNAYAPAGSYVLQVKNGRLGFYQVENDNAQKIRQYSAYLKLGDGPANAGQRAFYIDLDTEGIEKIESDKYDGSETYGINGQRTGTSHKGLTIRNGKISFIK